VKQAAVLLGLACAWAAPSAAQFPELPTFGADWVDFALPKIYYAGADGFTAGLYYAQIRQLSYEEADRPEPYRAIVTLDGEISTSGSKRLQLETRMPRMWSGWRAVLTLEGSREARARYFGVGNDAPYDRSNVTSAAPYYYRIDYRRLFARAEVQRRLIGPVRLLAGVHAERWTLDTLSGASRLAVDAAGGTVAPIERGIGDVAARIGLVVDTPTPRSPEMSPIPASPGRQPLTSR
jgi:hypothetical protein